MNPWRLLIASTLLLFSLNGRADPAADFADGQALGNARKGATVTAIKDGTAKATDPNYNTTAPQKSYFGSANLSAQTTTLQALCAASPNDPTCAASALAVKPRPKQYITNADPALAGTLAADDPSTILGNIATTYSACATDTKLITPAAFALSTCRIDTGAWTSNACSKSLAVVPKDKYSCIQGEWYAKGQADRNGQDHVYAQALCETTRRDSKMKFQFYADGADGACKGWQEVELDMSAPTPPAGALPAQIGTLAPDWGGACQPVNVYAEGPGCSGKDCKKTFHFFQKQPGTCQGNGDTGVVCAPDVVGGFKTAYTCPANQVHGDEVTYSVCEGSGDTRICSVRSKPADRCFARFDSQADAGGRAGELGSGRGVYGFWADMGAGTTSGYAIDPGPGHWAVSLAFKKPNFEALAGDYWANTCTPFETKAINAATPPDGVATPASLVLPVISTTTTDQCTRTKSACVDGPSTKIIDGIAVTRECWKYDNVFDCATLQASTTCNDPSLGKCSQAGPIDCLVKDGAGHCLTAKADFNCKTAEAVYGPALNCGAATFCPGGSCYDATAPKDVDFAQAVTMLEAGREAARYLDPNKLKVFVGYDNRCIKKLFGLVNCCKGGGTSASASFNNLSVAASAVGSVGKAAFSTYAYDALFTTDAPNLVIQGFEALFGTGLDSGLAAVIAGDISVEAFMISLVPGPWTIAMLVIQFSGILDCPKEAQVTAMKRDANLCHAMGDFCSSTVLGTCQEQTQTFCCYPSRLAKIINEQGRTQLGQSWGTAQIPSCGGFTIAELQGLDFASMDLSEFYAEIAPTLPDLGALQAGSLGKKATCYYGAGKC